ncbi:hypothetical protein AB0271_00855 [Kocuria palustris]|uniref:hypothetical protein n=1 Tax=Kocuria palustris TaxID=71999 RepID=UPI00344B2624
MSPYHHQPPPGHTVLVEPYTWTFHDGRTEDGYRIYRGRQSLWVNPRDAYDTCVQLADLLDAANAQEDQ